MSLTQQVKAEARRLGFQLVGVTTPEPPAHLEIFDSWLKAGRHGEMGYLATERARQRRADPRAILPECQSILVLGVRYPTPESALVPGEAGPHGQVAAYAWGEDFHHVLTARMADLVDFLEAQVGASVPHRGYTDSGPLLERELAQRAGLGWIGKNTCLINPEGGSYYLLAELLLGIELEPDHPFIPDHCGSCQRCLEACPTSCILPDRTIDASRCISYLTIELKEAIPSDLRAQMGSWVFGCDICQQVCPWNQRFATAQGDPAFAARQQVPKLHLIRELSLSAVDFNRKFKNSPVKRSKRRGYLRNICVALGNARDPHAVPALAMALASDPEELVRAHAAWALGQIGGQMARPALESAAFSEKDPDVLGEINTAIGQLEANEG